MYGQFISSTGLETENHEEVRVVIEDLNQSALEIGLTESRIRSRVNVRLRQVNLRPVDEKNDFLYVAIHVVGNGVSTSVYFYRTVYFFSGDDFYSTLGSVYVQSITGTHGADADFIISGLDQLLDQFLSDYLDAND